MASGRVDVTDNAHDKVKASELLEMVHEFGSVNAKQLKTVLEDRYDIKQKRTAEGMFYLHLKVNEQLDDDEVEENTPAPRAAKIDVSTLEFAGIDYIDEEEEIEEEAQDVEADSNEEEEAEEDEPSKKAPSKKTRAATPKKLPKEDEASSAPIDNGEEEEPVKPVPKKKPSPKAKPQKLPEDEEEEPVNPVPKTKPPPKAKQQKLPEEDETAKRAADEFNRLDGRIRPIYRSDAEEEMYWSEFPRELPTVKPKQEKKTPAKKVAAKPRGRCGGFSNRDLSFDDEE